jgi:hypothetical protein
LSNNDFDRLASHLPADFSHSLNIPREMLAVSGMREGKAETIFRLQEIFEGFDTQYIEPGQMTLDESRAVLDLHTHCKHRLSSKWLDTTKKHVCYWKTDGPSAYPSSMTSNSSRSS